MNPPNPTFIPSLPVPRTNPFRRSLSPATYHPRTPASIRSRTLPLCTVATPRPTPSIPTKTPTPIRSQPLPAHPDWRYVGPSLDHGPLPAVLYLALTAEQSLQLDPFNQLVTSLQPASSIRIFSVTLPFHTESMHDNENAFLKWADTYRAGGDLVASFTRKVSHTIDSLVATGIIQPHAVYMAGLSRGALLAAHVAANNPSVSACLAFAPVTVLSDLHEFAPHVVQSQRAREKIERASLSNDAVVDKLNSMPVRVYMGNSDRRVGTRNAFAFSMLLAERAREQGIRSPPHEFIMYSSIGKDGHGTPPEIFAAGADYLMQRIRSDRKTLANIQAQ